MQDSTATTHAGTQGRPQFATEITHSKTYGRDRKSK